MKHPIEKAAEVHNIIVITVVAEPYDKHNVTYDYNLSIQQFPCQPPGASSNGSC